jgi:hypothetical protein
MANSVKTTSTSSRIVNGNGKHAAAVVYTATHISGRVLNQRLRKATPSQKAIIVSDLHTGRLEVAPLTWAQSLALAGGSYGYAYTSSKITDAERAAVVRGQSLSAWHTHTEPEPFAALTRAMNAVMREVNREIGDADISVGDLVDRLVAKYPDRVLAALDRVTSPELPFQAAE